MGLPFVSGRVLALRRFPASSVGPAYTSDALPVSRPAVSQHLKVLKKSGLVVDRPQGTRRIYRVVPTGLTAMREYLDRMWDPALAAFAAATEDEDTNEKGQDG
jgi:DNA-binding transcriptional ArsR family regulator